MDDAERRNALIKSYMDFAFLKNTKVFKFSKIPSVTLHCEQDHCLGVSQEVAKHLPRYVKSEIANSNSKDSDVNIYFKPPDQKNVQIEDALEEAPGLELVTWGPEVCHVEVLRSADIVEKISITVSESEGGQINIGCILYELLRASGGNMKEQYEEYVPKLSQLSEEKIKIFYAGIELILRIHWSDVIPPGTSKYETQKLVERYLQ